MLLVLDKSATGPKRKRGREIKKKQLSWLKVGQVETVREVSSRAPDGVGAGEFASLPRVFSLRSRVDPEACSPNESHVWPGEKVHS